MLMLKSTLFCLHVSQNSLGMVGRSIPLVTIHIRELGKYFLVWVITSMMRECSRGSPPSNLISMIVLNALLSFSRSLSCWAMSRYHCSANGEK